MNIRVKGWDEDALAMMHFHRITGTKFGSHLKEGQGRTECAIGGSASVTYDYWGCAKQVTEPSHIDSLTARSRPRVLVTGRLNRKLMGAVHSHTVAP
jgi:hypothetical protein